jgi:putative ABC transport system substrate-binding protein
MRFSILDFTFWINRSKKRRGLVLSFCAMLGGAAVADAQQPKRIPRIGYLSTSTASAFSEAMRLGLRDLGYVEGQNIILEYRYAEEKADRLPKLAEELVRLKVDLIFANSATSASIAKKATQTIPIVFYSSADPVSSGLVESLARPGGNLTGFASIAAELAGKRLQLMKDAVPNLSRVAVLWERKNQGSEESWKQSRVAAREMGLQIHSMTVNSADKFESAFKDAIKARSDALAVTLSALFSSHQKAIVSLATNLRFPAIYTREEFVDNGGLMSYGAGRDEPFKRIPVLIDKILKGARPADLPVEQPTKFEFVVNLKAAQQIGLTIPPNVLARADRVIR